MYLVGKIHFHYLKFEDLDFLLDFPTIIYLKESCINGSCNQTMAKVLIDMWLYTF